MRYYGNPYQPGTPQWSSQQMQNQLLNSQDTMRRREDQRQRDFQAQRWRRAGGQGSSAGWWILQIIGAVVALVIILSNIT
jgi:hypothetical protein